VALAALVRWTLGDVLNTAPLLVFFLAWVATTAFGGLGPVLTATLASWVCIELLFDATPGSIRLDDRSTLVRLSICLAGGLAVSIVAEQVRRVRRGARRQERVLATLSAVLQASEQKYRFLVENSKDITWTIDTQGRWTFISSNVERVTGYRADEVIGRTLWEFLAPACHDLVRDKLRRRLRGEDLPPYEVLVAGKDGRHRPFEVLTAAIVDDAGAIVGVQGVSRDILERKRAEEALRELNATLESRVAERTRELEQRARQLQKLALELTEAEQRERQRIAEILHDDLQQVLAAAKFQVSFLKSRVKNDAGAQEIAGHAGDLLVEAVAKSRSLSHELGAPILSQNNLGVAFEWLARQMQTKYGLTVQLDLAARIELES